MYFHNASNTPISILFRESLKNLRTSFVLYFCFILCFLLCTSGEGINKSYFPILVPIGVVGNILSFLVSWHYFNCRLNNSHAILHNTRFCYEICVIFILNLKDATICRLSKRYGKDNISQSCVSAILSVHMGRSPYIDLLGAPSSPHREASTQIQRYVQKCATWTSLYRDPPPRKYLQTSSLKCADNRKAGGRHSTGISSCSD